jgi:hypothetical protein
MIAQTLQKIISHLHNPTQRTAFLAEKQSNDGHLQHRTCAYHSHGPQVSMCVADTTSPLLYPVHNPDPNQTGAVCQGLCRGAYPCWSAGPQTLRHSPCRNSCCLAWATAGRAWPLVTKGSTRQHMNQMHMRRASWYSRKTTCRILVNACFAKKQCQV